MEKGIHLKDKAWGDVKRKLEKRFRHLSILFYCVVVAGSKTRQVQFVMPFIFVGHEKKGLRYPVKMGLKT